MLLSFLLILLHLTFSANIKDCSTVNCVILDDADISKLLSESVLYKEQVAHLHKHYYHQINVMEPAKPEIEPKPEPIKPIKPKVDSKDSTNLDANITAYNVVTTFLSTANILYTCGCLILTCAYIVLLYWFRRDSPYIQIALTFTYHYIYHIIANLLSHTMSSRILAAILYISCCNMPTISLFIYLFHPKLLNGYGLLQKTYEAVKTVFIENANTGTDMNVHRWDIYFVKVIPSKLFIYAILLCLSSMITPFIYTFIFETEFIGIFAVFTATLYALTIILGLFSLKSDRINSLLNLISKSCLYGDCRCLYLSIIYFSAMFIAAYKTNDSILCTVCIISGLNVFCWSFPCFLFIDIFKPQIKINWDMLNGAITNSMAHEVIDVILSLLQQNNDRYRAFIITNIVINWCILQLCIMYSSWIAVPYAVSSLFILSYAVTANMKWSMTVHLPIAYTLFKACFAYIYIIDIATLDSLSWIAPQNILLWIVTTSLRFSTSLAASLQITRAIYWITLTKSQWESGNARIMEIFIHGVTLYFICNVFLYFTYLEPNAFISFLFQIFGISYGSTLILSMGQILTSKNRPWCFFVINMVINLRLYVLSYTLILPRICTFMGSLVSYSLCDKKGPVEMHLSRPIDLTIAVILGIGFYAMFGVCYDCKVLILTSIILLCGYVSFKVWEKTNSKRAALMVLSILAVILIQVGLRFETGSLNGLTIFGIGRASGEIINDGITDVTWELSSINYYFHNIFFQLQL